MKRITKHSVVFIIIAAMILSFCSLGMNYTRAENSASSAQFATTEYETYLKDNASLNDSVSQLNVDLISAVGVNAEININPDSLIWNNGNGTVNFSVDVKEAAFYTVQIVWRPLETGVNPNIGFMVDGAYLYRDLESVELFRTWINKTEEPNVDSLGNEYAQEQMESTDFLTAVLRDNTGVITEPYLLALTTGSHTLGIVAPGQSVEIQSISLCPPEETEKYEAVSCNYDRKDVDADIITIEGENAAIKSNKTMIPKSNNSDAGMTPSSVTNQMINYIGSTSWQNPGDTLTWNFQVETEGYYSISMRYKQSELVNGESLRWLKIDGKTPFDEAKTMCFPYGTAWKNYTLSDTGCNPCYIWLEAGTHTLSMEVTIGAQAELVKRLSEIVDILGDKYIDIIMITSESPDLNMDYELFNQVPDLESTLTSCKDQLQSMIADMKGVSGSSKTQSIAALENMLRVLQNMLRNPFIAQQYLSDYYSNYASVSSWLYDMKKMPLSLDQIQIVPSGSEPSFEKVGFFKGIAFAAQKLAVSFTQDYQTAGMDDVSSGKSTVRLWVNWGLDQTSALNSIIKDSFTRSTGINVQLEIVNASLVNGILSGNFPDVSLHMARTEPVNLGMRGALADLKQFDDYQEVLTRFQPGAQIPYEYNNALYALPDTQTYLLMYYRTDILSNLGLNVPENWDEFRYVSTIIQRNNMNVYVPYTQISGTASVNSGIGSLHLLPTLLAQNGLSLYNESRDAVALNDKDAIRVFNEWTDFYTDYSFLKEADFYNRFRLGSMPLGIAPLSTYMTLYSAAPEIRGRWSVALVPGTMDSSGNLNRTIAGAGTGCAIIEKSTCKDEAWEFLKWWTCASTQSRFNNSVESILGVISRTPTANVEAMGSMAWDKGDFELIKQQWSYVQEVPEIPGSYYLTRSVDQAFWNVVNGESNAKDALSKWCRVADNEIKRKITEYS